MKKRNLFRVFCSMALVLMPCVATLGINGNTVVKAGKKIDMEEILPGILSFQISEKYQKGAIQAQAVIARSNLYRKLENRKNIWEFMKVVKEELQDTEKIWKVPARIYTKAVEDTRGLVLTVDGSLKLVPYHELSAGETRDGEETFHDKEYSYLKSVDSSQDKASEEFLTEVSLSAGQVPDDLKIKEYDEAGYVFSLETGGEILEGETFAWGMGLPSSNFLIQREGNQLRIVSKGKGHGLGFSQYGGNELAKEGKTWKEILNTYFPEMEISNYL